MGQRRERDKVLLGIIAVQLSGRDFDGALETAEGIEKAANRVEGSLNIAEAQYQAGLVEAALETYELAREAADKERYDFVKQKLVAPLASTLARIGDVEGALEMAKSYPDEGTKAQALREIAVVQAQARQGAQAVETAGAILTGRGGHLPPIALALAEAGDEPSFREVLFLCADAPGAAVPACAAITILYPDQAAAIAAAVLKHVRASGPGGEAPG